MRPLLALAVVATLACNRAAVAQLDQVAVDYRSEDVGLAGYVRPGTWAPMRLTLDNPSGEPRRVICRWTVPDSDGDQVLCDRLVTLTPARRQTVWLYAPAPITTDDRTIWQLEVFDATATGEAGRRLAGPMAVKPARITSINRRAVGLTSTGFLGLDPFETDLTQHEGTEFLRGLDPVNLPDHWHGLSLLEALIWTGDGGSPGEPGVPIDAIRQWVMRGGHLVVVVSASLGFEDWANSPLASMMPAVKATRVEGVRAPSWFGYQRPEDAVDLFTLEPAPSESGPPPTVLLTDDLGRPVVVASPFGFGRVTVIGIDLTDPGVDRVWLKHGSDLKLWNRVFGWRAPPYERRFVESQLKQNRFVGSNFNATQLDRFIPAQVSRSQTIAAALFLAMAVFTLYWLAAGPVGFALLRARGPALVRHSWLAFIATVGVFSVIAWGGAWLLQPGQASFTHLTVLDADARTRQVRAQSWLSMFVPAYGRIEFTLDPESVGGNGQLWSSTGSDPRSPGGGFVDTQAYQIDAAQPARALASRQDRPAGVELPIRATTKALFVDYVGPLPLDSPWLGDAWVLPVADNVRLENGLPRGTIRHKLPGTLRNVLVIYCPGVGNSPRQREPWFREYGDWPPDRDLLLDFSSRQLLAQPPSQRGGRWGGLLAAITGQGQIDAGQVPLGQPTPPPNLAGDEDTRPIQTVDVLNRRLWTLSFFSALPPPPYEVVEEDGPLSFIRPPNFARGVGRSLDLTHMAGLRRLMVIGMIENSRLPIPIAVNGQRLDSTGWTLVRWHLDLP